MDEYEENCRRLLSLLEETLAVSEELLRFTREKHSAFAGGDEKEMAETLREREKNISALINMECKIDLVLEQAGLHIGSLPHEAEALRQSIRSSLDSVTEIDIGSINLISGQLQEYRDLTIKARNKKKISAYMKTGIYRNRDNSFDLRN
ncbi:MAG: hypothetical protein EOM54_02135 [Clostridia bacterium]|nr:hypothetical protein [Clostridia bacterium]